jgi:hypothetical protein
MPVSLVIAIAGISDRNAPKSAIGMRRNRRSECAEIGDRNAPDYARWRPGTDVLLKCKASTPRKLPLDNCISSVGAVVLEGAQDGVYHSAPLGCE